MQDVELLDRVKSSPELPTENPSAVVSATAHHESLPVPQTSAPRALPPQFAAARGIGSIFDLDPRIAVLATVTDLVLFTGDIVTFGGFVPVALFFAACLGFITYQVQTVCRNDDRRIALIKAMIIAFLTALPGPITPFFAIPGGIIGVVKAIRRR